MEYILPYQLTRVEKLQSLVEHRSKFNLDFCELNVFETRQQAEDFHLRFNGVTITSMLRGKKVMHLEGMDSFDYVPGETVIAPQNALMRIDFPEAAIDQPTQCTALVLDNQYLNQQLALINEKCAPKNKRENWAIDFNQLVIKNNRELARTSSQILSVIGGDAPFKDYQVDLMLRELVLVLLKQQNLGNLRIDSRCHSNSHAFAAVLSHIEGHISSEIRIEELCRIACMSKSSFYRAFVEEYGITPVQLILEERIKYAKSLLMQDEVSVKEAAYASGFNDPNYFSRMFRKLEGISPTDFKVKTTSSFQS
ncbi:MAG: helix-turn-helix domain-containing protein [Bacteroidetes bacterium]|nr:MAG: helix-turn-helix domain-containing protein [Bacteroidota bacterium]